MEILNQTMLNSDLTWDWLPRTVNVPYPISWRHFNSFWTLPGPLVGIMCFKAHRTSGNVFILAK